ncbi:MAG: hypothetical protein ACN4GZ_13695 [Acidimicrobiales bacterium]
MNGRCHNDPMDFAAEVCDSCGDQFCTNCLVYPRGTNKPPFCTSCAMALSGVRNRRPIKPLPRGEIKKRRKRLRAELAQQETRQPELHLPGSDLINGPEVEIETEPDSSDSGGFMGRFRRRKTDPAPVEMPAPQVTIVGGKAEDEDELLDAPPPPMPAGAVNEDFVPTPPEHSSATAILEQLKEQEAGSEDDVWLPPAGSEATTWTLPEINQSPLGGAGPWEGVATTASAAADQPSAEDADDFTPPVFVSEAELRSQGPADTDLSGNWVPPTLRGMAPQAGSNGAELPRRRRQESQES